MASEESPGAPEENKEKPDEEKEEKEDKKTVEENKVRSYDCSEVLSLLLTDWEACAHVSESFTLTDHSVFYLALPVLLRRQNSTETSKDYSVMYGNTGPPVRQPFER